MTKQEYYDLLVKTSASGGFPAIAKVKNGNRFSNVCRYRAPNGKKCAIGIIIPDEFYGVDLENMYLITVINVIGDEWVPQGMSGSDLCKVQNCHDEIAANPPPWDHDEFVQRLNNLACFSDVVKETV